MSPVASIPRMVDRREFAARLGLSICTLDRMESRGEVPASVKVGKRLRRWPSDVVDRFIAGRK